MIDVKRALRPIKDNDYARSAIKAVIPERYRGRLREWLRSERKTGMPGVQWCRVVMNMEIEKFVRSLDCPNLDVLEISGTASSEKYGFRSYRSTEYPEYDVCVGPLAEAAFDLIVAEQVLEHVSRPDLAVANIRSMLRPGGKFVVCTPFLLKIHGHPDDFYRWTENGMRLLLEAARLNVIETGSWGNRECLTADLSDGIVWSDYDPAIHTLRNEPQFPIVVWAFARKVDAENHSG